MSFLLVDTAGSSSQGERDGYANMRNLRVPWKSATSACVVNASRGT
jgi:hypothetical protein